MELLQAIDFLQGSAIGVTAEDVAKAILICARDPSLNREVVDLTVTRFLGQWQEAASVAEAEKLKSAIHEHFSAPKQTG